MLLFFSEGQRRRVDAIPFAGRFGAVVKDVAEMPPAPRAGDFELPRTKTAVGPDGNGIGCNRLKKTRPAGAGVILCVGGKKRRPARGTMVHAVFFVVFVRSGKWRLRPPLPKDMILLRRQEATPLVIGALGWFSRHGVMLCRE